MPLVARNPARPEAKGDRRRRGRRKRPARVGELPLTAWKRCGMLTTMVVKGKPAKNALLDEISEGRFGNGGEPTYRSMPTSILSFNNLIGKIGSCTLSLFSR